MVETPEDRFRIVFSGRHTLAFILVLSLFTLQFLTVYASVFTYYPVSTSLSPVPPPLVLSSSGVPDTSVYIGANATSANATVIASSLARVLANPDFYSNADYWYCSSSTASIGCYWLASDTGASGGVVSISGTVGNGDYGLVYQYFETPRSALVGGSLTVSYRVESTPSSLSLIYGVAGIYDPVNSTTVWSTTWAASATSYTSVSYTVDVTSLEPGRAYIFYTGVYVAFTLWSGTLDYRVDSAYLEFTTADRTFNNIVVDLNVTDAATYYARLVLLDANITGAPDVNVTIENTTYESTPIRVEGGLVVSWETGWVMMVQPGNPLYVSGHIRVSTSKASENITLHLGLEYCSGSPGGGACVTYPIVLVVDPPSAYGGAGTEAANATYAMPVSRVELARGSLQPSLCDGCTTDAG